MGHFLVKLLHSRIVIDTDLANFKTRTSFRAMVAVLNKIHKLDSCCTHGLQRKQMDVKSLRNLRDCLSALLKWDYSRLRKTHSFWASTYLSGYSTSRIQDLVYDREYHSILGLGCKV